MLYTESAARGAVPGTPPLAAAYGRRRAAHMRLLAALSAAAVLLAAALADRRRLQPTPLPPRPAPVDPTPGSAGSARCARRPAHPPLLPTREASVLYRITTSNAPPTEVRITTQPNAAAMRIDMPDHTYMLLNPAKKHHGDGRAGRADGHGPAVAARGAGPVPAEQPHEVHPARPGDGRPACAARPGTWSWTATGAPSA